MDVFKDFIDLVDSMDNEYMEELVHVRMFKDLLTKLEGWYEKDGKELTKEDLLEEIELFFRHSETFAIMSFVDTIRNAELDGFDDDYDYEEDVPKKEMLN